MDIVSEENIKKSFRVAYEFMRKHICVLETCNDYQSVVMDLKKAFAENKDDPLTCRLISGVFDYICAESEKQNDGGRITE